MHFQIRLNPPSRTDWAGFATILYILFVCCLAFVQIGRYNLLPGGKGQAPIGIFGRICALRLFFPPYDRLLFSGFLIVFAGIVIPVCLIVLGGEDMEYALPAGIFASGLAFSISGPNRWSWWHTGGFNCAPWKMEYMPTGQESQS